MPIHDDRTYQQYQLQLNKKKENGSAIQEQVQAQGWFAHRSEWGHIEEKLSLSFR